MNEPDSSLSSWNDGNVDPCSWSGITCDPTNTSVTELDLSSSNIAGSFPTSILCNLTTLLGEYSFYEVIAEFCPTCEDLLKPLFLQQAATDTKQKISFSSSLSPINVSSGRPYPFYSIPLAGAPENLILPFSCCPPLLSVLIVFGIFSFASVPFYSIPPFIVFLFPFHHPVLSRLNVHLLARSLTTRRIGQLLSQGNL
ncbi:hypothetical protein K1719_002913 [Acacia pycnantha]|nr:hypothetical protein K1719_002913 [Acacia pycnantha]